MKRKETTQGDLEKAIIRVTETAKSLGLLCKITLRTPECLVNTSNSKQ